MIKYDLICDFDHNFDAWFASSEVYEEQTIVGVVQCPFCGSTNVTKALMAPGVSTKSNKKEEKPQKVLTSGKHGSSGKLADMMRELRRQVEENAEYVGPRFAEEARKIHEDETSDRSVYGEASSEEVRELKDDGIETFALPVLPEEQN
ncbi:MAG: DUF1178 family protein [Hyphomicrobiales bacterium]